MGLSNSQLSAIQLAERVSSVLSVIGCLFVITTYLRFAAFYKPINRLVFYASWGNLATNVATIISRSGITAGVNSPLCQFQGFLIQMFMPADSLWTLAMAVNVYLTFFHRYSASQLRSLEWKYLLACYCIPFVPALVFIFIKTEERGHIFGSAVLWCWITVEWNTLRIAVFYGPVWVVLLATMTIYVFIGRVVYANRKRLRELSATGEPFSDPKPEPLASKTTEVHIKTSELPSKLNNGPFDNNVPLEIAPYAVEIGSNRVHLPKEKGQAYSIANRAAWAYLKCAMLFFLALLITWVPATINRLATLADPNLVSFPLNFIEALFLPLQGFWNAIIYITTSVPACTTLYRRFFPTRASHRSFVPLSDVYPAAALEPRSLTAEAIY
ncbi:hypothetical protein V498_03031 [Pseudogymnoascus sp. VKM F-4517 (FW-2822)]|nr:hypothetical protein V498_03031 [Pseudogymnoascus sp. VKM F-4517 (FW-2822)]